MLDYENNFIEYQCIAGIDEAGRGPLAGPVSVASVIMPLDRRIDGIDDSKKLTEKKREALFDVIVQTALAYHVELIDEATIDQINILEATKLGMSRCITALSVRPDLVLIDAVKGVRSEIKTVPIIHGDALSYNIAAASILAKVTRDRLMEQLDEQYPQYGFKKHKGYGTPFHIQALKTYGPCPIHRKSFIGHFVEIERE